jgi:hypothetical protein
MILSWLVDGASEFVTGCELEYMLKKDCEGKMKDIICLRKACSLDRSAFVEYS